MLYILTRATIIRYLFSNGIIIYLIKLRFDDFLSHVIGGLIDIVSIDHRASFHQILVDLQT